MEKATILIVDDEEDIIELVQLNLAREGYQTLACTTGEKALEIAQSKLPNLVILDIMLPGMDGFEICRKLRQAGIRVPILVLTAKSQEIDKVLGLLTAGPLQKEGIAPARATCWRSPWKPASRARLSRIRRMMPCSSGCPTVEASCSPATGPARSTCGPFRSRRDSQVACRRW